ncbi:unnamed protein product [Meloidogyne enterolobii]|uniref:Uncharacterized protein n=1 Tax=Meloidogyne enterolobii TaxID=390850 RepID=A0ACB0YG34_MELEN
MKQLTTVAFCHPIFHQEYSRFKLFPVCNSLSLPFVISPYSHFLKFTQFLHSSGVILIIFCSGAFW